jgi:hypothetical protein
MQALPIIIGLAAGYWSWTNRPRDRPFIRPLVQGDTSRCVGDPTRFHLNANYLPLKSCDLAPTWKVVLVKLDQDINKKGEDVEVAVCDQHLKQAEAKHAEFMEDEPRAWQSYMFPLKSPTERIYKHVKM